MKTYIREIVSAVLAIACIAFVLMMPPAQAYEPEVVCVRFGHPDLKMVFKGMTCPSGWYRI